MSASINRSLFPSWHRWLRTLQATTLAIALSAAAPAALAVPSTQVVVDGAVNTRKTFDLAGLQQLTPHTQTVTYTAAGASVTDTFTGPLLWDVLNTAGITVNQGVKNDILNKVVVATGTDGYKSVVSLGEINPSFGNRADLVAYADTAGSLPAAGFARTTAPGDVQGGRYVSNLAELTVVAAPTKPTSTAGGQASSFTLGGDVVAGRTFDLAALQSLTQRSVVVGNVTYTGVSFLDVLQSVGIATDPNIKNDILRDFVVATGSDGYQVAFSLGELLTQFGGSPVDLIAYASSDGSVSSSTGFARLIVPGDVARGRYVSNLVSLQVFDATAIPEPETLALFAVGAATAVGARRVRRKSSVLPTPA